MGVIDLSRLVTSYEKTMTVRRRERGRVEKRKGGRRWRETEGREGWRGSRGREEGEERGVRRR
jgi:hypothetical protein